MSKKNNSNKLALAIIATFEPLALNLDQYFDATNGHEAPSVTNNFFRMLVGMGAQQYYRQLADGTMKRQDGTPIDNITTQIAKASQNLQAFINQTYQGQWELGAGDPYVARQTDYIERLVKQEEAVTEMLDGFKEAYIHFFKEEWAPQQAVVTNTTQKDAVKAKLGGIQERLAKMAAATKVAEAVVEKDEQAA